MVNVVLDEGGGNHVPKSNRNEIHYDPVQVAEIRNARSSDLNEFAPMIFQHELAHTNVGGRTGDPSRSAANRMPGKTVKRINRMRKQLGKDYGQRVIYGALPVKGHYIMPFSKKSYREIKKGNIPSDTHLKF